MKKIFLYIIILASVHPGSFAQVTEKDSVSVSDYAEAYILAKTRDTSTVSSDLLGAVCSGLVGAILRGQVGTV